MNVRVVEGDLPTLHDQCATMRLNIRAPLRTGKRLADVPLGAQVAITWCTKRFRNCITFTAHQDQVWRRPESD